MRSFQSLSVGCLLLALALLAGCDNAGRSTDEKPKRRRVVKKVIPKKNGSKRKTNLPKKQYKSRFSKRPSNSNSGGGGLFSSSGGGSLGSASSAPAGAEETKAMQQIISLIEESVDFNPTLVVWLLDLSPSSRDLISATMPHVAKYYRDSARSNKTKEDASQPRLLTAIVGIGQQPQFLLEEPTGDAEQAASLLSSTKQESSGKEAVFTAIDAALKKYLAFRTKQRRDVIFVVITDEAGDDAVKVDSLIAAPKKYGLPIYVVGLPAPFGRPSGTEQSTEAPGDYKPGGSWTPILQGPESLASERIDLAFWGQSQSADLIDSGFGPFALERLCRESGGKFIAIRPPADEEDEDFTPNTFGGERLFGGSDNFLSGASSGIATEWPSSAAIHFDPKVIGRYAPDYVSAADYQALLEGNKARMALHNAAKISQIEILSYPRTDFLYSTEPALKNDLDAAQQSAARLAPLINLLYETIRVGESARDQISEPRWQAGFDLAMGRTLAAKARIDGYNAMLAILKQGRLFKEDDSTTWALRPADTSEAGSILQKMGDRARTYLNRVIEEHPGTPWSYAAKKELQTPIGWKWTEQ